MHRAPKLSVCSIHLRLLALNATCMRGFLHVQTYEALLYHVQSDVLHPFLHHKLEPFLQVEGHTQEVQSHVELGKSYVCQVRVSRTFHLPLDCQEMGAKSSLTLEHMTSPQ